MPVKRRLLRGETTYSAAIQSESNILLKLSYVEERNKFFSLISQHRQDVAALVAYHLSLSPQNCCVAPPEHWIHGSFNVCVPVKIEESSRLRQVMARFPLPYRVGENAKPGNADEKVLCEAGAYAWLQDNCPSVPIPYLHGFGLSSGLHYKSQRNFPRVYRWIQNLHRFWLRIRHRQSPTDYVPCRIETLRNPFGPYLVIDYVDESEGQMLSETWEEHRGDKKRRVNLFRGLARLMLSLSRIPLPKIGSFTIDNDGFLHLTNRPLTSILHELENAGTPMHITRDHTYTSVISYVNDLLTYQDNRLSHNDNAVKGLGDCSSQMCALTIMRAVAPQFYDHDLDVGPFAFCLTDLHQSNIFVDSDWNITHIIDLEWSASLPLQFVQLPYWISGQHVDTIDVESYNIIRKELMDILESEGGQEGHGRQLSAVLESNWQTGTFWFNFALRYPPTMHSLFYNRIQPQFAKDHLKNQEFYKVVPFYWCRDAKLFIRRKLKEKEEYDDRLRREFEVD